MKNIIKNSLIIFAVIVLTISLFDVILWKEWSLFNFFIKIAFVSIIICLAKSLTVRIHTSYYIIYITIDFLLTLTIVMVFGYIFNWYEIERIWLICSIVLFAYIICFFLGIIKTNKNIELINKKLKERKNNSNYKEDSYSES